MNAGVRKRYRQNCIAWIMISVALTTCVRLPIQDQQPTSPPSPIFTLEESERCRELPSSGLPAEESVRNSHILFLAYNSDTVSSQVWAVSMKDGSRRLILDDLPSPYLSIALLEDENQFLLAGSHTVWRSDLSGTSLEQLEEPSLFLSSFRPYSPMWNALARSSGLSEGFDIQTGRLHSPDSRKVAAWQRGDTALRITDKETGEQVQVLPTGDLDEVSGSWSPDGELFAFTYYKNTEDWYTEIYVVNADGTSLRPLTQRHVRSVLGRPNWSLDGRQIAVSWQGVISSTFSHRLHLLTLATGEVQVFDAQVYSTGDQDAIVWSPDGKWVAFLTDNLDSNHVQRDIQVISLETGESFCVTQDESIREELMDWH
jgi:hypothetical protein